MASKRSRTASTSIGSVEPTLDHHGRVKGFVATPAADYAPPAALCVYRGIGWLAKECLIKTLGEYLDALNAGRASRVTLRLIAPTNFNSRGLTTSAAGSATFAYDKPNSKAEFWRRAYQILLTPEARIPLSGKPFEGLAVHYLGRNTSERFYDDAGDHRREPSESMAAQELREMLDDLARGREPPLSAFDDAEKDEQAVAHPDVEPDVTRILQKRLDEEEDRMRRDLEALEDDAAYAKALAQLHLEPQTVQLLQKRVAELESETTPLSVDAIRARKEELEKDFEFCVLKGKKKFSRGELAQVRDLLKAAFQNNFTVPLEGELENLGHLLSSKDSIVALALDRRQDRQNPKIVGITVAEMGRVPVRLKEGLRTLKLCELTDGAVSPELQRKGLLSALSYELLKRVAIEEPHAVFGEARALNPGVLKALFRMGFVSGRTAVGTSLVSGTTGGTSLLPQHVRIGGVRDKKMLANLPDAWRFNFGKHEPLAVVYLPPERLKNIQLS